MIWSKYAIDYSKGIDIVDILTGKKYTQEQAIKLPNEIKERLINKPRKIGCFVMTIKECEDILRDRRKNN